MSAAEGVAAEKIRKPRGPRKATREAMEAARLEGYRAGAKAGGAEALIGMGLVGLSGAIVGFGLAAFILG